MGDASGLTVKAQLRRATANLGYGTDAWRVREALYGRAGSWSGTALDDLRTRFEAWRQREEVDAAGQLPSRMAEPARHLTFARRLDAIRAALADVQRQVDEMDAEVSALSDGAA